MIGRFSGSFTLQNVNGDYILSDVQSGITVINRDAGGILAPVGTSIFCLGRFGDPSAPTFDGRLYVTVIRGTFSDPVEIIDICLTSLGITKL